MSQVQCQCGIVLHVASGVSNFRCPQCRKWIMRSGKYSEAARPEYLVEARRKNAWVNLHSYPFTAGDWSKVREWFAQWHELIPTGGCQCREHWSELIKANPPDAFFGDRLAFFAWGVARHNDVNRKLGRPELSLHEARLLYDLHYALTQPEAVTPSSRLAVVSIASGKHLPALEQTRPRRADYAERIGADLVELTDDRWPDYPMYNKFRLASVSRLYERVLYVDSDVVIRPDAPNVFDVVPESAVGVVDELPTIRANGETQAGYLKQLAALAAEHGLAMPEWCPNAGVLVLPRMWASVYDPPLLVSEDRWWCLDQYLLTINCELVGAPVHWLGGEWNWCWIDPRFWTGTERAYMLHANGTGSGDYRREILTELASPKPRRINPPPGIWQPNWRTHEQVPCKPSVGFLSLQAMKVGGTETWHMTMTRALGSRLPIEGMGVVSIMEHSPDRFGCQVDVGIPATKRLVERCDAVIAWGTRKLADYMPPGKRPALIHVHHGDETSQWSDDVANSEAAVVDCLVTVNPRVAEMLRERHPGLRVEYMPNAVDPRRVEPETLLPRFSRPTVVWCARMHFDKRPELALAAAEVMPDWTFVMIGDGVDRPKDPPPNVILTGPLPHQADWLAIADVFLSTSSEEGFGLSMGEAMLAGVPVASTPFGLGLDPSLVRQMPANPTASEIADAIVDAYRDEAMAARAKAFIQTHHNLDLVGERWERLIRELCRC